MRESRRTLKDAFAVNKHNVEPKPEEMNDLEKERWILVGLILSAAGEAIAGHFGEK